MNPFTSTLLKPALCAAVLVALNGCVTMSGVYTVTAQDASGKPIPKLGKIVAEGRHIYTARNAMCSIAPDATVIIRNADTGEELKSESPHHC
ncbi:hypothetical protein [Pseudomonas sp.]|uniref:hypothetical protein n=1 Tax=Pseudomonas sp. TaxID=306 RepID=UPI0028A58CE3|nr:hypothetical protein [Pseudomonas sp.]